MNLPESKCRKCNRLLYYKQNEFGGRVYIRYVMFWKMLILLGFLMILNADFNNKVGGIFLLESKISVSSRMCSVYMGSWDFF